jgi:hypothetical protein
MSVLVEDIERGRFTAEPKPTDWLIRQQQDNHACRSINHDNLLLPEVKEKGRRGIRTGYTGDQSRDSTITLRANQPAYDNHWFYSTSR